jgi:single-stranded-DNA-specific exonuclease
VLAEREVGMRWEAPERNRQAEKLLETELGVSSLAAATLVARGLSDVDVAKRFLSPSLDDLHDPMLLPDAQAAVEQILAAREKGERVYVHGDYDADGVTSTAIWTRSLTRLGFDVIPHVPHRMKEGYGIHMSAIEAAIETGAKLLVTCDCGSSATANLARAREAGMRVVVTDHHELPDELPVVNALVNPHRKDCTYPYKHLAGAGVAFKIAQAVSERCGASRDQFVRAFVDLACLGTIADIMPLTGENRIIAKFGLQALQQTKKVGIQALKKVSSIEDDAEVTCYDVGFKLGPRINAAGRVDDAERALDLLLTDDLDEANRIALQLDKLNEERRVEELRILAHAQEIIEERELHKNPLILVAAPAWHKGVVGIVASRIVERYYRPALVGCIDEEAGIVGGSARSIQSFVLIDALTANHELFITHGGHALAAGFSFEIDKLEEVTERLIAFAAERLTPEDLIPKAAADAEVDVMELDYQSVSSLAGLGPFGHGNPQPTFIIKNARLESLKPCGGGQEHMQFKVRSRHTLHGIAFNKVQLFAGLNEGDVVDLLAGVAITKFNGQFQVKLDLQDLRPC